MKTVEIDVIFSKPNINKDGSFMINARKLGKAKSAYSDKIGEAFNKGIAQLIDTPLKRRYLVRDSFPSGVDSGFKSLNQTRFEWGTYIPKNVKEGEIFTRYTHGKQVGKLIVNVKFRW